MLHSLKTLNTLALGICLIATSCAARRLNNRRSLPEIPQDQNNDENGILSADSLTELTKNIEKRQVNSSSHDPDHNVPGEVIQNPNDPKYRILAQEALNHFGNNLLVLNVKRAATVLVAGDLIRLNYTAISIQGEYDCSAEIYDRLWHKQYEFLNNICIIKSSNNDKPKVGGETDQNPQELKYYELAKSSLSMYILRHPDARNLSVFSVDRVTTQIVAGVLIRLHYTAVGNDAYAICYAEYLESAHATGDHFQENECQIVTTSGQSGEPITQIAASNMNILLPVAQAALDRFAEINEITGEHKVTAIKDFKVHIFPLVLVIDYTAKYLDNLGNCHTEIHLKWDKSNYLLNGCDQPGGQTEQNADDPKYLKLVLEEQTIPIDPKNITIEQVTTQVVAGTITRITYEIKIGDSVKECRLQLLETLDDNKEVLEDSCAHNNRTIGGETVEDPHDPKYKILAELSLLTYLNSHAFLSLNLKSVDYVTEQLVSGLITRVNYTAASGLNLFACHAEYIQSFNNEPDEFTKNDCVFVPETVPGGWTIQDPHKMEYRKLAQDFIRWLVRNKHPENYAISSVNRVRTQVVGGFITEINFTIEFNKGEKEDCHATIYDKIGKSKREYSGYCGLQ